MAQYSRPWEYGLGDGLGAAADGSYTATEWDDIFWFLFSGRDNNYGVVRMASYNHLEVIPTAPNSNQVFVMTGAAIVNGKFYENDAAITFPAAGFPPVTVAGQERYDRVVLEADWATRTVRVARVAGVEAAVGAGVVPAMTQTEGVLFQVPLATIYVDEAAGVVVAAADITDDRRFIQARQSEFDAFVGDRPGDYTTIQDALDDDHKSIFLRAGTYTPAADITLTSGMWLCGESRDDTIINIGANQILINEAAAAYADHVIIENLRITGQNVGGSVSFQRARYCTLRCCYFQGAANIGIQSTIDSRFVVIENNFFDTCLGPISLDGARHRIINNSFYDIQTNAAINVFSADTLVQGNTIEEGDNSGIIIGATAMGCLVHGNEIRDVDQNGILVSEARATVVGNVIRDVGNVGISIGAQYSVIGDNHIYNSNSHGISFSVSGDYAVCKGNLSRDNGGDGIDIPNGCDQVIVNANICRNNTGWGIDYAGDRDIVTDNIALNNTAGQIDAAGATNAVQADNIVA